MDIDPAYLQLGYDVANTAGRNTVQTVRDKIKTARASKNKDEAVNNLEEIINELIADKNQLIQLTKAYEEEVITKKISNEDIEYITQSVVPLLEEVLDNSEGEEAVKAREAIDKIKPIITKETFNIMQLLGFNFKQAIGEPLTELVNGMISSRNPVPTERTIEYRMLLEQSKVESMKIMQDEEAFKRFQEMAKMNNM